jgi:hypothetical protein
VKKKAVRFYQLHGGDKLLTEAFGEAVTIPVSQTSKNQMKQLISQGLFKEQRDIWRLGAALGISKGKRKKIQKRETFQNINSLDPDGIFSAIMLGLFLDKSAKERVDLLVEYAEWGINEIYHQNEIGTLDFAAFIC